MKSPSPLLPKKPTYELGEENENEKEKDEAKGEGGRKDSNVECPSNDSTQLVTGSRPSHTLSPNKPSRFPGLAMIPRGQM